MLYFYVLLGEDQYIMVTRADDHLDGYVDGVLTVQTIYFKHVKLTRVKCGAKLLAFRAHNHRGYKGLLVSLSPGNVVVSGQGHLKCVVASKVSGNDWKSDPGLWNISI